MATSSTKSSGLSELTVTCHQCGSSSMVRLDRKEYRCAHCGAITIISDDDADRLEQMLTKVLNRQNIAAAPSANQQIVNRVGVIIGLGVAATIIVLGLVSSLLTHSRSSSHQTSSLADDSSVPASQVVISPLQWIPDSGIGGTYAGLLYNHSGYTIDAPDYSMTLFHNGMKKDTAMFNGMLRTLQPGEYERVTFRVMGSEAVDRYEIETPRSISRSTSEIAPATLLNPQFVHQQDDTLYSLIGVVQNTFTRPVSGVGQLLLYDKNQQLIGAGSDSFGEIRPGEKVMMSMSAWTREKGVPIAAYEYLIDAKFTDSR